MTTQPNEPDGWRELKNQCDDCGGEPPAYREGDKACAIHGIPLKSEADYEREAREAAQQMDLGELAFDVGASINRIARMGVAKW